MSTTTMVETSADVRRHELLADVAEQTARHLIKHGIPEDQACDVGNELADFLCEHWNGQNIYMVADSQFKLSKRDQEIFRRMQRGNAHDLAKEFGVSYVRIYQIHKRCLAVARASLQPRLFDDPGNGV